MAPSGDGDYEWVGGSSGVDAGGSGGEQRRGGQKTKSGKDGGAQTLHRGSQGSKGARTSTSSAPSSKSKMRAPPTVPGFGGGVLPPQDTDSDSRLPSPVPPVDQDQYAKDVLAELHKVVIESEIEMGIAKRTILAKNAEIDRLNGLISAGSDDPTLATKLAEAEKARDDARAEVVDLTQKLKNATGVVNGSLVVSMTDSMKTWTGNLRFAVDDLRTVNFQ